MQKILIVKSLRTKLILILLTVSLASILVVGLLSFFNARNSLQKAAIEALEANGNLKAQLIELFFQERYSDITSAQDFFNIKTNLSVVSEYANDRLNPIYINAVKMLDGQLQTFQKIYNYLDFTLVNSEGKIVYVCEKSHRIHDLDTDLSDMEINAFEEGKKGVYFSNVFINPKISNDLTMIVTAPAHDFNEKFVGVIVLEVDMEPIYKITQDRTGLGKTGETLIGKGEGNEFIFFNPFRHHTEYKLNQKMSFSGDVLNPIQKALQGNSGSGLAIDYRDEKVIAHWRYIPIVGWGLIAKIDQKEAFASIESLRKSILIFSISFIVILILFAVWIARKIVNPLNSLNIFATQVAEGNYNKHPKVTTQDEVGELTVSFINMSQKLQKYHTHLEELVKERTAELSISNAELAKAARLKDEFLANMSHELRTPLNSILGLSEALQEEVYGSLTQKQAKSLNNIESSGRHLLSLINEILDLAKIEAGKIELEYSKISLENLIQSSLVFIKQTALTKSLKVTSSISSKIEYFSADEKRMRQILVNLLSNAVKFTPEGGEISIEAEVKADNEIIDFIVSDTGIGIRPENLDKLFQSFVQIDSKLSRGYEGTGLGLALVKNLVELHNGSVSVESGAGKGSVFTVSIPLMLEEQTKEVQQHNIAGFENAKKVLIVEDNEVEAEQISRYLKEIGIDSIILYKGEGVLEKASSYLPDIIMLDIGLPDINGLELLKSIMDDEEINSIPVVMCTVHEKQKKAFALGASDYIIKPINRERIKLIFKTESGPSIESSTSQSLILLAEDNEASIETISDYLEVKQYRVIVARNGEEAVEKASEIKPDIILMDIQMPVMDGLTAIKKIRAKEDKHLKEVPIIAITALVMPGDEEKCLNAGANEYMKKPLSLKSLVISIQQLLDQKKNS